MIKAYAKVNLHLQIGQILDNSLHEVFSLIQKIDLYDELEIEVKKSDKTNVKIIGMEDFKIDETNSMEKAVRIWCFYNKINAEVNIKIKKNIPLQSGLGGPSSDAACILEELNSYFDRKNDLNKIALEVGSDVPFFVSGFNAAIVGGTGEIIQKIEPKKDLKGFVLIPKGKQISTAWAFKELDKFEKKPFWTKEKLISVYQDEIKDWNFENDFSLVNKKPKFKFLNNLNKEEVLFLSGSGAAWILITNKTKINELDNDIYKINFLS
ncbi:MAG: 4-(cytidine 5'-diphospho)-2-C-methyl-D-erythritol kinase [Sphaerochaetaceae bacterium]